MPTNSEIQQTVLDDLAQLVETFEPVGGLEHAVSFPEPFGAGFTSEDGRFQVSAWQYEGVHTGVFLHFEATGAPVTITGITIIDRELDTLHTSIDWTPVLRQIGVGLYGRPVVVGREA